MKEIIRLENIKRNFLVGDEVVHALRGVSFTIYEGEFVDNKMSGKGKYSWPSGREYEGYFENGKIVQTEDPAA